MTEHQSELALEVSGLSFSYPDQPGVLQDVRLAVQPGERVGLIGPNGAGKTTLFLLVCGVLKPNAGEIALFGQPMVHGDFRPEIGMIFQNPDDQLFCPSVQDDVAFGPRNMGLSKEEVGSRVSDALRTVGHLDLADRPSHHLSEGEKRMVSIAGVLAMQPRLILELCSRVLLMDNGRIVADGRPTTIMADDSLMETHGQEKPHSLVPHVLRHEHHMSTAH